jgi:hypothetical protein
MNHWASQRKRGSGRPLKAPAEEFGKGVLDGINQRMKEFVTGGRRGIVKLFENGWDAVDVSGLGGVICWLTVVFHAAAATVISPQTAKRLVTSIRQCGALIR